VENLLLIPFILVSALRQAIRTGIPKNRVFLMRCGLIAVDFEAKSATGLQAQQHLVFALERGRGLRLPRFGP
jgi:hypothetical protein